MDPRTGVDGKPYAIGFEIALPDNWNGRFVFQGGGGLNGYILAPLGSQAAGDDPALARGFAVVSTDTGHKGAVFDASFMKDQLASLDFAYIADWPRDSAVERNHRAVLRAAREAFLL